MEICNTAVPIAANGRQAAELVIGIERCGRGPVVSGFPCSLRSFGAALQSGRMHATEEVADQGHDTLEVRFEQPVPAVGEV